MTPSHDWISGSPPCCFVSRNPYKTTKVTFAKILFLPSAPCRSLCLVPLTPWLQYDGRLSPSFTTNSTLSALTPLLYLPLSMTRPYRQTSENTKERKAGCLNEIWGSVAWELKPATVILRGAVHTKLQKCLVLWLTQSTRITVWAQKPLFILFNTLVVAYVFLFLSEIPYLVSLLIFLLADSCVD